MDQITPTLIAYLHLCHRKMWLHANQICMESTSELVPHLHFMQARWARRRCFSRSGVWSGCTAWAWSRGGSSSATSPTTRCSSSTRRRIASSAGQRRAVTEMPWGAFARIVRCAKFYWFDSNIFIAFSSENNSRRETRFIFKFFQVYN